MPVANLPPLNADKTTISIPTRAGIWSSEEVNLDALADSFDIPAEDIRSQDLKSIPDVWAQFQVFNSAFAATSHPMHQEAQAQWRGLLALFALADEYSDVFELVLRPIQIPAMPDEQKELFLWVLRYLLPTTTIAPGAIDWTTPVLLLVREKRGGSGRFTMTGDDQLLGLLNPVSLVAPGKSAATVKIAALPWLADGLSDPLARRPLKKRDYQIISEYCLDLDKALKQATGNLPQPSRKLFDPLSRELQSYAEECFDAAGGKSGAISKLTDSLLSTPPDFPAFYKPMLKIRRVDVKGYEDVPSAGESQAVMRNDLAPESALPFKGIILIDPQLSETLKKDARDIRIWKHRTLSDVLSQGVFDIVVAEATIEGYLVVRPDDFFIDEMVHLEQGSDIRGHAGSGFESTVLPLSPLALLLEAPAQLVQYIELQPSGGREHKVTFSIALSGSGARHMLSRVYRSDTTAPQRFVSEVERPLGFAVWPDFYNPNWRWNFLRFQQDPSSTDLQLRFGLSGPQLSRDIGSVVSPTERVKKMAEWLNAKSCIVEDTMFRGRVTPEIANQPYPRLRRLRFSDASNNVGEIQISANAFEAIALSRRPENGEMPRPVGLVLLERQNKTGTGGKGRVVAVDFGTTNTVASYDGVGPVQFKDRVVFPISHSSQDQDRRDRAVVRWTFVRFMPLLNHETPIPTVAILQKIDNEGGDSNLRRIVDGDDDRPLFADGVFFMPAEAEVTDLARLIDTVQQVEKLIEQLKFGLKWSSNPHTKKTARRFLRQMMIMICAELVDDEIDPERVTWRFSYPEAMNRASKMSLLQAIRDSWKEVFYLPNGQAASDEAAENAVEPLVTEGGAAANFFLSARSDLNAAPLAIILDIGGGTTEVAIWSGGQKLCWRGSFRLAGGDFFTHYLVNNPEFFEMIDLKDLADKGEKIQDPSRLTADSESETDQSKAIVELTLNDRRVPVQFQRKYPNISDTPVGAGLRHCASVALGGLAFYLAEVVRRLVADGVVPQADVRNVSFAMGGRGSQFFRQIAGGTKTEDSPLHDILRIFQDALDVKPGAGAMRVQFSAKPKLEVVLGMVGDAKTLAKVQTKPESHWMPLGETLDLKRAGGEATAPPATDVETVLDASLASYPKLDELKRFLSLYEGRTGVRIDLRESQGTGATDFIASYIYRRFNAVLADAQEEPHDYDPTTQLVEPPFIMGLRALVDLLGRNEESRERMFRVIERH